MCCPRGAKPLTIGAVRPDSARRLPTLCECSCRSGSAHHRHSRPKERVHLHSPPGLLGFVRGGGPKRREQAGRLESRRGNRAAATWKPTSTRGRLEWTRGIPRRPLAGRRSASGAITRLSVEPPKKVEPSTYALRERRSTAPKRSTSTQSTTRGTGSTPRTGRTPSFMPESCQRRVLSEARPARPASTSMGRLGLLV
jgi:hypothetical protein